MNTGKETWEREKGTRTFDLETLERVVFLARARGSVTVTMEYTPTGSAVISGDGKYRYHLRRPVAPRGRIATFIMLNPSTADAWVDDPTIRKCIGFCQRWGCGELHVANLFAFRATNPAELRQADDPVGPDNREWVQRIVDNTVNRASPEHRGCVVCAWGTHGSYMDQDRTVLGWIRDICEPVCLGVTQDGHPRHPLYVPYSAERVAFKALATISGRSNKR